MKTTQQILEEIDRLVGLYGSMSSAELALDDIRKFILSEPSCPHTVIINGVCKECGKQQ